MIEIKWVTNHINWRIFFIGQFFWLMETWHYGWNVTPQSDGEIVCDGIVLLITALSLVGSRGSQHGT